MNKENLAKKISKQSALKKKQCQKIIDRVFELILLELKSKNEIIIDGFGKFKLRKKEMRIILKSSTRKIIIPPEEIIEFEAFLKLTKLSS